MPRLVRCVGMVYLLNKLNFPVPKNFPNLTTVSTPVFTFSTIFIVFKIVPTILIVGRLIRRTNGHLVVFQDLMIVFFTF